MFIVKLFIVHYLELEYNFEIRLLKANNNNNNNKRNPLVCLILVNLSNKNCMEQKNASTSMIVWEELQVLSRISQVV